MNESTSGSWFEATTWFHRQRRRVQVRRSLSVASRFAGELLEDRTLLSSVSHLIGNSPPVKDSELVLDLPTDPLNNRTFHALSSDSKLGTLDSGLVTAQTWDYSGPGNSKRLRFEGTSADGTEYSGNIRLAPAINGSLDITKNGQTVSYHVSPASANVTISGEKFNDFNGNGTLEAGEPGLPGWTIDLIDKATGALVAETMSGSGGQYSFRNAYPGSYTIAEKPQTGWTQTAPAAPGTYSVFAFDNQSISGQNFGNFQTVTVSGSVYNDLDGNGSQNAGEPGLASWTVDVVDGNNNVVASGVSDAGGNYTITGVGAGSFTLREVVQGGWTITQPTNPSYYSFTTSSGVNVGGGIFGNHLIPENLSGLLYNDLNGDGSSDGGTDPALAGWTITLLDSSNNLVATMTSAADGTYSFTDLPVQQYTIQEVAPAGWTITQPTNPPGTYTVPAGAGNHAGLDFGNFQLVSVSGSVYNDLDGNGSQNAGEPGLASWTVDVVDGNNNVVASGVSDAGGNYTITGVGAGSFTLREVVQGGWTITQPTNPSYYSFTTSSGVNVVGGIFGNFRTITVSGNVYNDLDGDSLKDGGEPGLQDWTVNLEDSAGNILATVPSDADGSYTFAGVGPGTYQVAQVVQTGWVQTHPQYPTVYTFTTQSGHNLIALNFGDHAAPVLSPSAVIDNGQAGYSETGNWNTVVGGFNGTNRVARTVHSGVATATATWDFTGVANTLVDVWVTYAGKGNYSKAAPFTVYDGGTSLGTQYIDESILVTQSQGGRTQGSYGGVGWLELGTFLISSGEIKVVLNNLASGTFVDADGVLIVVPGGNASVHSPAVGSSSGTIAIGTADIVSSPQPSTGSYGRTAAPTIELDGIPAPTHLTVIYDQNTEPIADLDSTSAIDAVLHRVISRKRGVRTL